MTNPHTISLINNNKDVILNHFGQTFYMSVMTNKPHPKNQYVDLTRKNHGHAHLYVQKFTEQSNGFKDFDTSTYYYVTSSIYEVKHTRCLTLREDLILSWNKDSNKNKDTNVLVLDAGMKKLYDIPATKLIELYTHDKASKEKSVNFTGFTYIAFDLDDLGNPEDYNESTYSGLYNRNYLDASYLGTTTYSKYRSVTECYLSIFDKNGLSVIWDKSKKYKSLKEAFSVIEKFTDISYKTFQRRFATGDVIILNNGAFAFVTSQINQNQFYQPLDISNFEKETDFGTVNKSNTDIENEYISKNLTKEEKLDVINTIDSVDDSDTTIADFGDEDKDISLSEAQKRKFLFWVDYKGYSYIKSTCSTIEDYLYYMKVLDYDETSFTYSEIRK